MMESCVGDAASGICVYTTRSPGDSDNIFSPETVLICPQCTLDSANSMPLKTHSAYLGPWSPTPPVGTLNNRTYTQAHLRT